MSKEISGKGILKGSIKNDIGLEMTHYGHPEELKVKVLGYVSDKYVEYVKSIEDRKDEFIEKIYSDLLTLDWYELDCIDKMDKETIADLVCNESSLFQLMRNVYNPKFSFKSNDTTIYMSLGDIIYEEHEICEKYFNIKPIFAVLYENERDVFEYIMHELIEEYREEDMDNPDADLDQDDYFHILLEYISDSYTSNKYRDIVFTAPVVCALLNTLPIDRKRLIKGLGLEDFANYIQ